MLNCSSLKFVIKNGEAYEKLKKFKETKEELTKGMKKKPSKQNFHHEMQVFGSTADQQRNCLKNWQIKKTGNES